MKRLILILIVIVFLINVFLFLIKFTHKPQDAEVILPSASQREDQFSEFVPKKQHLPEFVEVPEFRPKTENSVYGDIMSHSKEAPFGDAHGRSTNAHETVHGINSYLRNKYSHGKRVNGFYAMNGKGVIVEEPDIRKSQVNQFVPRNLRSYRFALYLDGQQAWDDTPLYICDEWIAYISGGKCNVDDVQQGKTNFDGGRNDGVYGCLDFSIYVIGLCMAVKQYDPEYWENNIQFKNFVIWGLREAQETFTVGRKIENFKWQDQDKLLKEFLTSSSGAQMRQFVKDNLNGVWLDFDFELVPIEKTSYSPALRMEHGCELVY